MINLLSEEIQSNPYPTYNKMRENTPICQINPNGMWAVTRYEDVEFTLKRHDLFSSSAVKNIIAPSWLSPDCRRNLFIATEDPPIHTCRRSLVNKTFVTGVINTLIPMMQKTALELTEKVRDQSNAEFIEDFSYPFVNRVINAIVGLEEEQHVDEVRKWIRTVERVISEQPNEAETRELEKGIRQQISLLKSIVEDRRKRPRNDFVTKLANATGEGFELTDDLIIEVLDVFVRAGYMTTVHMLGTTVLELAQKPELANFLRANNDKIENFVEEILRLYTTAPCTMREANQDIEIRGITIPKGAMVLPFMAAANRDPRYFSNPDSIDLNRPNSKEHLSFGNGPHVCLGLALVRLELNIATKVILDNTQTIEQPSPSRQPDWIKSVFIRGLDRLPICFS